MKKIVLTLGLAAIGLQSAYAYDVSDRYKILEDRFKTQDMLNPIGHDFFFDVKVGTNQNLIDVIGDASDAADTPGDDQDRLAAAQDFLDKYEKTEQTVNAHVGLGFPLPSFSAFDVKFKPNFRASWNLGLNMGIFQEQVNANNIFDLIDVDLPSELKNEILDRINSEDYAVLQGSDIVGDACAQPDSNIPQAECDKYEGRYFYPDTDVPNIFMLAKQDVKAGFYTNYTYGKNIFGSFNVYGMHRTDVYARVSEEDLSRDGDIVDLGDELNSEVYLTADWHMGWKQDRYSIFGGIEEINIATLSERKEGSKEQTYGTDPLLRLHAQAEYRFSNLTLTPFVGFHKRSGYGVGDGAYVGTDLMAHMWAERLALRLRGQVDKEHLTVSPMVRLWFMHLDYTLKQPLSSEVDGIEVATLHSLNIRLFF